MTFNVNNTEGFTQTQLNVLNEALSRLINAGFEEKEASDKLNNAWSANDAKNTVELLVARVQGK